MIIDVLSNASDTTQKPSHLQSKNRLTGLFTLRVSWSLYLALMRGVWMMSRLVPVTVTAVCPLKQRRGQKVKSDGCDRWWWYFTLWTCANPWIIHFGEMLSFYLWSSFKIIRLGQMSIRMCLLTCRCSTLAQSWWWWDPPHTQSVGLSGDEPCLCSQTQGCSRSRAKMRGSCRWATDPPS